VKDRSWVRSPIDAFVLNRLEAAGVAPAPPASKRTLIRRATLDLTGLPPTPDEVNAFLVDESPDAFEREADNAWLTNGLGAENVARAANEVDAGCVYISTAGIFGGEKEYFNDFDVPNPLSIYAKSKYHGERFVCENVRKHYVFRAGWMMGGGLTKDKKFINKLYKQIAAGKSELHVVDDKLGTPTYTWDFANGLSGLIGTELYGVYNQANEGSCSRFDVAVEFVRLLGLAGKIRINRVDSDYFKSEYYAPRPASEKLINLKLNALGLNAMRDWKVCLAEYSATFKQHYQEHVD